MRLPDRGLLCVSLKVHSALRHAPLLAPLLLQLLLLPPPGRVCGRLGRLGRGRQRGRQVARHRRDGVCLELRVRQHLAAHVTQQESTGSAGQPPTTRSPTPSPAPGSTPDLEDTRAVRIHKEETFTRRKKGGAAITPSIGKSHYLPQALRLAGGDAAPGLGAASAQAFPRRARALSSVSLHLPQGHGQRGQAQGQGPKAGGLGGSLAPPPLARAAAARREHRPCGCDLLKEAHAPQHLALQVLWRRGTAGVWLAASCTAAYRPSLQRKQQIQAR